MSYMYLSVAAALAMIATASEAQLNLTPVNCARDIGSNASVDDLRNCLSDLQSQLNAMIASLNAAAVAPSSGPVADDVGILPETAVVAFAAAQCPEGWSLFSDAGGRFIIGAGQHRNTDDDGNPLEDYGVTSGVNGPAFETGGVEEVTLSVAQMPEHAHPNRPNGRETGFEDQSYIVARNSSDFIQVVPHNLGDLSINNDGSQVAPEGQGQPHTNLPPYIALYWCQQD